MNALDRNLLGLLQVDNQLSLDELAEHAGSSRSVVHRRLRDLRGGGYIRADVSILDPNVVGDLQTFVLQLSVRQENSKLLDTFIDSVSELPQVQQCYLTTGSANCVVVLLLEDAEALDRFVAHHFTDDPFVCRFRSNLVTRNVKLGLTLPLNNEKDR